MGKKTILNKLKMGFTTLAFLGFASFSNLNAQDYPKQNLEKTVLQEKIKEDITKTSNLDYYVDTSKYKKKCIKLDFRYKFSEKDLKKFNVWIDSTITKSARENKKSIIIDKSAYTLYLIDSGKVHSKYPIEMGRNPFDDKKIVKDGCTPEGEFSLIEKKPWSNYHKAFLINYPLIEDAKKGLESKLINKNQYDQIINAQTNKQTPNQYTKLGGLIEIHGEGSGEPGNNGGYNWTLGCIGLSNKDMDKIFPLLEKGSKVTIVRYTNITL